MKKVSTKKLQSELDTLILGIDQRVASSIYAIRLNKAQYRLCLLNEVLLDPLSDEIKLNVSIKLIRRRKKLLSMITRYKKKHDQYYHEVCSNHFRYQQLLTLLSCNK